ncbi:MAG: S26 family signal peptidase [Gemmataceae bacterium]|nr:S26 family signal peptidase [Gemmataceae bacterium]MCI0737920.1 S26 family signal peptidase [Gemmataceae bacterium]
MKMRKIYFWMALATALLGCGGRSWSSGDRVLVAKYLYETKIAQPQRFEVVVFKYPNQPLEKGTPKNYIKRLLGLPGEILAIFFGRLFHIPAPPPGAPPHFNDLDNKAIDPNDLWKSDHTHRNDPKTLDLFDAGKFQILRKPPEIMLAMRRIVYDNDFPAKDLTGPEWERWRPEEGAAWAASKRNGFVHDGGKNDAVDWLRYWHVLRPGHGEPAVGARSKRELITDFMAYNSYQSAEHGDAMSPSSSNWVGDLMLECKLDVQGSTGEFWMELSKGIHRFRARFDLSSGMCTLFKVGMDKKPVEMDSKQTGVKGPGSYNLRFANFDARLTVWVDRELPFGNGRDYPPPEMRGADEKDLDDVQLKSRFGPTGQNDLEPASLGAKGAVVQVHGIRLWRDTYYTRSAGGPDFHLTPDVLSDPQKWGFFKDPNLAEVRTLYVQPGHYLCLGDNSPQSSDGRDWGLVPERLMLGRALLVYFPFNRAGPIR